MAVTTVTASLAAAGVQPKTVHTGVTLAGTAPGKASLSASASSMLWLCKLPYGCKNVQLTIDAIHTGATGAKLQFGTMTIAGSQAGSLISTLFDIGVTTAVQKKFAPIDPAWTNTGIGAFKYLQCTTGSGTTSAAFVLNYTVTYDF